MSIYTYDNTTISLYSTESYGDVTVLNVQDDYGSIVDAPTNLEEESNLSLDSYGEIAISEDNYPFGTKTVGGSVQTAWCPAPHVGTGTAYLASTALEGIRKIWDGNGSLFEMGGGMERSSAFWVGSGGITVSGSSVVSTTLDWNEDLFVEFTQEDLGLISLNPDPLLDFGGILDPKDGGEESWGFVYNIGDVRGATSYHRLVPSPWHEFNTYSFTTDQTGTGGLFAASGLSETKTSTELGDKTTLFSITGGEVYSQTSREVMSGNTSYAGAGIEKFVHEYNEESTIIPQLEDRGLVFYKYDEQEDLGTTVKPITAGEYDNGEIWQTDTPANTGTYSLYSLYDAQGDGTFPRFWEGSGSIHISGQDLTVSKQHWVGSGSLYTTGGAAETQTDSVLGDSTTLFDISSGYSNLQFQYHWTGSGTLTGLSGCSILRTFGYDETAFIGFSSIDRGLVTDSVTLSEDWGITDKYEGQFSDNWWYIWHEGDATSYGTMHVRTDPKVISDSTPENYFQPGNPGLSGTKGHNWNTYSFTWGHGFVQGGSLFGFGGSHEAAGYQPTEDTALFTYSGAYTDLQATYSEVGSGSLFTFSGASEKVTFDYNQQSHDIWTTDEYGLISDSPVENIDLGIVTDVEDSGEENWGTVWWNDYSSAGYTSPTAGTTDHNFAMDGVAGFPYGYTIFTAPQFFGETYCFQRRYFADPISIFTAAGAAESTTTTELGEDTSLGDLSGGCTNLHVVFREIGSGSISRIGGGVEKVTFDYSDSTVLPYSEVDYGLITDAATGIDYGLVVDPLDAGEERYGEVIYSAVTPSAQGTLTYSLTRPLWTQEEIDELLPTYETKPFGTFPQVGDEKTQEEAKDVRFKPIWGQFGRGSLYAIGGAAETVTFRPNTTGIFNIVGGDYYLGSMIATASFSEIGSGGLSSIVGGAHSVTFDYNESSIVTFTTDDQGSVTDNTNYLTDHFDDGFIASPQEAEIDYGTVIYTETVYPVTGSIDLYTSPDWIGETYRFVWRAPAGTGGLFAARGAAESKTSTELGDSTTLFDIYTSPAGIGNTYRFCWNFVGSGNLPVLSGASEARTYDYNQTSHDIWTTDDYGLVSDTATVLVDYSDLTVLTDGEEDYNTIWWNDYTSLGYTNPTAGTTDHNFAGNGVTGFRYGFTASGTSPSAVVYRDPTAGGSLFSASGAGECVTTTELGDATTLFDLFTSPAYIGNTYAFCWNAPPTTGGLFTASGCAESVTKIYDDTCVVPYTIDDRGSIADAVVDSFDWGSIAQPETQGEEDGGSIVWTDTATPFGSLEFGLVRPFWTQFEADQGMIPQRENEFGRIPQVGDEKTQEEAGHVVFAPIWGQIGEGSLYSVGGAAETAAFRPVVSTALFDIFTAPYWIGNTYRYAWSYVGSGNLPTTNGAAESVTFDYNESSINTYVVDDEGNIVDAATVFGEYGDLGVLTQGEEDYGSTEFLVTTYPLTGTLQTSGISPSSVVFRDPTTGGSLFSSAGAAETKTSTELGEGTTLFGIADEAFVQWIGTYVGQGSIGTIVDGEESVTYDYNESSIVPFSSDDQGLIITTPATPVDLGIITVDSIGGVDYGSVIYTATAYPVQGTINLTGGDQFAKTNVYNGSGDLFTTSGAVEVATVDYESVGLFDIFTAPQFIGNTYRFIWNAPPGTGGLFSVGGGVEKVTFDYNESSIVTFSSDDYGLVTDTTNYLTDHFDLGLVTDPTTEGEVDRGSIVWSQTVYPVTGTITLDLERPYWTQEEIDAGLAPTRPNEYGKIPEAGDQKTQEEAGHVKYEPIYAHIGGGTIFALAGAAESKSTTILGEDTSLGDFSGNGAIARSRDYIGTGTLFGYSGAAESVTFDYNETSIVTFSGDDYGLITDSTNYLTDHFDWGLVTDPETQGEADHGSVIWTSTVYPVTGLITLTTAPQFVGDTYRFCWNAPPTTGSLWTAGGAAETKTSTEFGEDTSLGDLSGSGAIARTRDFIGSGTLFGFSGASESVTYDYNQTSHDIWSTLDWGSVLDNTSAQSEQIDYGFVSLPTTDGEETYGTLWWNDHSSLGYTNPTVGTTDHNFAGNGVTGFRYGYTASGAGSQTFSHGNFNGSGSLFKTGGAAESATFSPANSTALFDIFTAPQFVGNTYCFIWNAPPGSGSLYSIGGGVERVTVDYNQSASIPYITDDHGQIVDAATTLEDQGLVSDPQSGGEYDNGSIVWTAPTLAAQGTIYFGLAGDEAYVKYEPEWVEIGSGSVFTMGGAAECKTTTLLGEDTSLGDLSGTVYVTRTFDHVGTGTLFGYSGAAESRTYAYNESASDLVDYLDYGYVIGNTTQPDADYGDLGVLTQGEIYYGTVINEGATQAANGEITLAGAGPNEEGFTIALTRDYIASGSLFTTGGAAEVVAMDYEAIGLFDIFTAPQFIGQTYSFSWKYDGTGNINTLSGCAESRTWHYSDTLPSTFINDDYGLVANTENQFDDWGNLGPLTQGEEDYGSNNTLEYPGLAASGTYTIGGVASTPFVWRRGCDGGTYLTSGEGLTRPTTALTGEGSIYIYTSAASIGNTYSFVWRGGCEGGSLFSAGGAAESTTTNPPEDTLLYTVGGTKVQKVTVSEVGSGSITLSGAVVDIRVKHWTGSGSITLSGTKAESFTPATHIGSGTLSTASGAAESITNADTGIGLFDITASTTLARSRDWVGSGSATLSGDAVVRVSRAPYLGSGSITISGTKDESFTPATHVGAGSLFTTGGAAEVATVDYENILLTTIGGTLGLKVTLHFYGAGSLFTTGGAAESTTTNPPENTTLHQISGAGSESKTFANYTGSGSITLVGQGSENYTGACTGSGTVTISGEADLIYRVRYFGSGSLWTASGASESVTTNPPESTSLHQIGGTRIEKAVFREIGSGAISLSGAGSELYTGAFAGSGSITISGEVVFKVRYILTGSGSISTFSGAAEAVGTNPPEDTAIGTFSGVAVTDVTLVWVGQGSYYTSGAIPEPLITKHWTASGSLFTAAGAAESKTSTEVGEDTSLGDLSGIAVFRAAKDWVGSGSLWTASGAAEAVGTNPPESTVLYTYVGAGIEKHTERWVGSGSFGGFSGAVSDIQRTFAEAGSGSITLSGSAIERQTDDWVGSGSLFTTGGGAESTTTNPPENIVLFTAAGQGIEKHTERYVGDTAQYTASGNAATKFTPHYTGSGSLFTALGAAESISTTEVTTGIFTISGDLAESRTFGTYSGSGSISLSGSATESARYNPPEDTAQYTLSGQAFVRWIPSWIGSGSVYISGQVTDIQITKHWTGSGSLFTTGGTAESITTNPPENTTLHKVSGDSHDTRSRVYVGSGSISIDINGFDRFVPNNIGSGSIYTSGGEDYTRARDWVGSGTETISGNAGVIRTHAYDGSGTAFAFGGGVESATVDYEDTTLYDIHGSANEAYVRKGYIGSGSFGGFSGTATDIKLTYDFDEQGVEYKVSGEVTDIKRTFGYTAPYGSLFALGGGVETATVDYENILLATIRGTADVNFEKGSYQGQGTITLTGESLNELRTFEPPYTFVTII